VNELQSAVEQFLGNKKSLNEIVDYGMIDGDDDALMTEEDEEEDIIVADPRLFTEGSFNIS